jgi:hypothetical protein
MSGGAEPSSRRLIRPVSMSVGVFTSEEPIRTVTLTGAGNAPVSLWQEIGATA